jgi:tetratricopeptide (TPR) repeat protein
MARNNGAATATVQPSPTHPISSTAMLKAKTNGIPRPASNGSQSSTRPSTWLIFLFHFALPMTLMLIVSNIDDIYSAFTSLVAESTPLVHYDEAVEPPTAFPSISNYEEGSNAVIDQQSRRREQGNIPEPRSNKHEGINSNNNMKSNNINKGTGPQSSPLYKDMETKIIMLRTKYEESRNTPSEILAAVRYADYLKYRDTTIHDGGTYQMDAIKVYSRAIDLLQDEYQQKIDNGEEVRLSEGATSSPVVRYSGLNREMFLDYDSKSTEGKLCATYSSLGKVFFMSNMFDRAVQSYNACLSYDPYYFDALTSRAQALLILGKFIEAGTDYKLVLELDTNRLFVDAVTGLAKVLTAKEDEITEGWGYLVNILEQDLPRLKEAYENAKLSNNDGRVKHYADGLKRMHHAMFAYHDVKTKNVSEAWEHLSKGNMYKLSTVAPFDAAFENDRVLRLKQVFTPNFFPKGVGSQTRTPIFIIGFVRSGSTLLERILDSHPLIVGTGEDSVFNGRLDFIRNEIVQASTTGNANDLQVKVKQLADDVVSDMKSRWEVIEANMHDESETSDKPSKLTRPNPTRFADKMLTNYMNVGFIHMLFPDALILHVAREPMDTIFSAFKHDFPPGGLDYTADFAGLAQLYHSYREVMRHWDTVLPGRVTHIRYEDMVTDLPNVEPKTIDAVGVPWDPTVLDFHKKKQAVNTLSTTQVRKGLYSHHFKEWKRYEEFLHPLLDLVGSEVKYDLKTTLPGY